MKNYGLIIPPINTEEEGINYILGSSKLKGEVINPSGDWRPYLPDKEPQNKWGVETMACTAYATLSAIETLLKFKGYNVNYSDRYLAIVGGVDPYKGSDPHKIAECIRNTAGCLKEDKLPFSDNIKTPEEYYGVPREIITQLMKEGQEWWNEWEFHHEWIFRDGKPNEKRLLLQEALTKGSVCVSVSAWHEKNGVYYKPAGSQDNHWTLLSASPPLKNFVFDTYDNYEKVLEELYDFAIAKVYYLTPAQPKLNILQQIINLLAQIVGLQAIFVAEIKKNETMNTENEPKVEEPKVEKKSKIIEWANLIKEFEKSPIAWNNPGAIKSKSGKFLKFATYQEGFDYLCDYLTRACTGKHKAYTPETTLKRFFEIYAPAYDNNKPAIYSKYVADRLGVDVNIKIKELV